MTKAGVDVPERNLTSFLERSNLGIQTRMRPRLARYNLAALPSRATFWGLLTRPITVEGCPRKTTLDFFQFASRNFSSCARYNLCRFSSGAKLLQLSFGILAANRSANEASESVSTLNAGIEPQLPKCPRVCN